MLLIVGGASDAGNNSEHSAESIVHAVDCVRHPTSTATVPAFALQNRVEYGARPQLWYHRLERAGVRSFFNRAFAQKIFHVVLIGQNPFALIAKRGFMFFFSVFHSTNRDLGPERAIQPTLQTPA